MSSLQGGTAALTTSGGGGGGKNREEEEEGRREETKGAAPAEEEGEGGEGEGDLFDVVFLGTGQSSGIPHLKHAMDGSCVACLDAQRRGHQSKNRRNNVSIAIIKRPGGAPRSRGDGDGGGGDGDGGNRFVLIDCGKTFRDGMLHLSPRYGLRHLGGLVLTHGHADAILGMDDVRDLQSFQVTPCGGVVCTSGVVGVHCHDETMVQIATKFDYLVKPPRWIDESKGIMERLIARLDYHPLPSTTTCTFTTDGVTITSFPVLHGGDYVSLGFTIGSSREPFVYISDVKAIPASTMDYLKSLPRIHVLVIDCLRREGQNFAHATLPEVLSWIDELRPIKTYLTGIGCGMGDHDDANVYVREEAAAFMKGGGGNGGCSVELAYDGMCIEGWKLV